MSSLRVLFSQASGKFIFSVTYNNLFIIDGTPEDSGVYMCSATNLLGQVTQQCEINFTLDDKKDTITEVCVTDYIQQRISLMGKNLSI